MTTGVSNSNSSPRSQSMQDKMLKTVRISPPPLLRKLKNMGMAVPYDKGTYDQFATRAPNFQSIFILLIKMKKEQLFGTTLTKLIPQKATKIRLKKSPFSKPFVSASDSPCNEFHSETSALHLSESASAASISCSETKIMLNLEFLVQVEGIFENIMKMIQNKNIDSIFNKCTEWWDETAKLQECLNSLYFNVFFWLSHFHIIS